MITTIDDLNTLYRDQRRAVIFELDPLVALDLEDILKVRLFTSVIITRSLKQFLTALVDLRPVHLALIGGVQTQDIRAARFARRARIPLVIVTGHSRPVKIAQAFPHAIFVHKPYSSERIEEAAREALAAHTSVPPERPSSGK